MFEPTSIDRIFFELDRDADIIEFQKKHNFPIWFISRYQVYKNVLKGSLNKSPKELKEKSGTAAIRLNWIASLKDFVLLPKAEILNFYHPQRNISKEYVINSNVSGFIEKSRFSNFSISKIPIVGYPGIGLMLINKIISILVKVSIRFKFKNKQREEWANLINLKLSNSNFDYSIDNFNHGYLVAYFESIVLGFYFKYLIYKVNPKLILIEDGNLGGGFETALILAAKNKKVKIAELQHGIFGVGYNFGYSEENIDLISSLKTDYIFSYGSFFSSMTNLKTIFIEIGCQRLEMGYELNKKNGYKIKPNSIMFISQMEYSYCMIPTLVDFLKFNNLNFILYLKLHPYENDNLAPYAELIALGAKVLESENSIYSYFGQFEFVVGHYSMALLDAVFFKKNIFIYDTDISRKYIPEKIGEWFDSSMKLSQLLKMKNRNVGQDIVREYFELNVLENFNKSALEIINS